MAVAQTRPSLGVRWPNPRYKALVIDAIVDPLIGTLDGQNDALSRPGSNKKGAGRRRRPSLAGADLGLGAYCARSTDGLHLQQRPHVDPVAGLTGAEIR